MRTQLSPTPLRILGLVVLMGVILSFNPGSSGLLQQLMLPVLLAVAAWLITRSSMAVALGGAIVAGIHSNLQSPDWIVSLAYPIICAICTIIIMAICIRRFRQRIHSTHSDRWRQKHKPATGSRKTTDSVDHTQT